MLSTKINHRNAPDCLLLIDLQSSFIRESFAGNEEWKSYCLRVQDVTKQFDHVIAVKFDVSEFSSQLAPFIEDLADHVLVKHDVSAFSDSSLNIVFDRLGIESVAIAGLETNVCVLQSFLDAVDAGYDCVILDDLCRTSCGDEAHDLALLIMHEYESKLV